MSYHVANTAPNSRSKYSIQHMWPHSPVSTRAAPNDTGIGASVADAARLSQRERMEEYGNILEI